MAGPKPSFIAETSSLSKNRPPVSLRIWRTIQKAATLLRGTRKADYAEKKSATALPNSLLLPAHHAGATTAAGSAKKLTVAAPCRIPLRAPSALGRPERATGIQ